MPMLFEVQTLDTETGRESWIPVEAGTIEEAKARVMVSGKAVGSARSLAVIERPRFRIRRWVLASLIGLGLVVTASGVGLVYVLREVAKARNAAAVRTLEKMAGPGSTDAQLATISFPEKKQYRHQYKVRTTYDRFDDRTRVDAEIPFSTGVSVSFIDSFAGKTRAKAPRSVVLYVTDDASVEILADGARVEVGLAAGDVPVIPTHEFIRMSLAKTVEMRIGGSKVATLDLSQRQALLDFASRLAP